MNCATCNLELFPEPSDGQWIDKAWGEGVCFFPVPGGSGHHQADNQELLNRRHVPTHLPLQHYPELYKHLMLALSLLDDPMDALQFADEADFPVDPHARKLALFIRETLDYFSDSTVNDLLALEDSD